MSGLGQVLIVEDDVDLRDSLVESLALAGYDAVGVGSCLEFYRTIAQTNFAVAVVDVGLPDQSGYVLAEYIRKNTAMGVIILTARHTADDRLRGYDAGADCYLVKPVDCRELAAVIANLLARLASLAPVDTAVAETWTLDRSLWRLLPPCGEPISLTAKELQFVCCLAQMAGNPIRRGDLLEALGYRDDEYASRAMDSLVRRLRRKIEAAVDVGCQPIKTAHTVGYCFTAPLLML